jgi:RNA-binding protein YlmH
MTIYQHFRPEEKPFVEKMMDWIEWVEKRGMRRLTDFLDPRQVEILRSLVNRRTGIQLHQYGGYTGAERVRGLIAPDDEPVTIEDYSLALIQIINQSNFHSLEHRDYLGAILHLGVKREKFGDLIVTRDGAQCVVGQDMAEYVKTHLHQVGRAPVTTEIRPIDEIQAPELILQEKVITVSSYRVDTVMAELVHLSRSKALTLVKNGNVKVNWRIVDSPSFEVKEGDVLSIRGFGRFHIMEDKGKSKKGNSLLKIGMQKDF